MRYIYFFLLISCVACENRKEKAVTAMYQNMVLCYSGNSLNACIKGAMNASVAAGMTADQEIDQVAMLATKSCADLTFILKGLVQ